MTDALAEVLRAVECGDLTAEAAHGRLRDLPFEVVGDARLDHHRALRTGFPEVVLGGGKSAEQIAELLRALADRAGRALATRVDAEAAAAVQTMLPAARYLPRARVLAVGDPPRPVATGPTVLVCAAGTSDLPVAEEACATLEFAGLAAERLYDVGIAGLHRVLAQLPRLRAAGAIIAVAGMDGALPAVIAGLVDRPVIAVPTSVGYGAHFGGLAPLLTMLNSCAPGVAVVNIDNGFGAACAALRVLHAPR